MAYAYGLHGLRRRDGQKHARADDDGAAAPRATGGVSGDGASGDGGGGDGRDKDAVGGGGDAMDDDDVGDDGTGGGGVTDAVFLSWPIDRRDLFVRRLRDQGVSVATHFGVWGAGRAPLLQAARIGINVHAWPAKVTEVTRLLHYMTHGVPAVSEAGSDHLLDDELSEAVLFTPNVDIYASAEAEEEAAAAFAAAAAGAVRSEQTLRALTARGFHVARLRDQKLLLAQTLATLFPSCAAHLLGDGDGDVRIKTGWAVVENVTSV